MGKEDQGKEHVALLRRRVAEMEKLLGKRPNTTNLKSGSALDAAVAYLDALGPATYQLFKAIQEVTVSDFESRHDGTRPNGQLVDKAQDVLSKAEGIQLEIQRSI